jgi:hypothetical protein
MKIRKKFIRDSKQRGEWAESLFLARANELGVIVSKPWGDSRSFDFVVGRPGRFSAVQVKCTIARVRYGPGYVCKVCGNRKKRYPPGSFDFMAAYVIPKNVWYIIPEYEVWGMKSLCLCTQHNKARYEPYLEAWHLLWRAPDSGAGTEIHACAEEALQYEDTVGCPEEMSLI